MTRKLMMITTAIVALATAPAVLAQGTGAAGQGGAGVNGSAATRPPGATNQQAPAAPAPSQTLVQQNQQKLQAPGSSLTTGGSATLNRQPMTRDLQSGKTTTGQVAAGQAATGEVKTDAMKMGETKAEKATGKMASRSSAKSHDKMMHKSSASANHRSKAYREMNNREIQATRDLNRQGLTGQQSAMAPTNTTANRGPMAVQGMAPTNPQDEAGVSGPANDRDGTQTSK